MTRLATWLYWLPIVWWGSVFEALVMLTLGDGLTALGFDGIGNIVRSGATSILAVALGILVLYICTIPACLVVLVLCVIQRLWRVTLRFRRNS